MLGSCDFCAREAEVRGYAVKAGWGVRRGSWCERCRRGWLDLMRRKQHRHDLVSDDWRADPEDEDPALPRG